MKKIFREDAETRLRMRALSAQWRQQVKKQPAESFRGWQQFRIEKKKTWTGGRLPDREVKVLGRNVIVYDIIIYNYIYFGLETLL